MEIDKLSKQFRHLHVELKNKFGDKYKEEYPDEEKVSKEMIKFTKDLRKRVVVLKDSKNVEIVKVEIELRISKIDKFRKFNDINDVKLFTNVFEIDDFISKSEKFLNDYYDFVGNLKVHLSNDDYEKEHGGQFDEYVTQINEDIKVAKLLKVKILEKNVPDIPKTVFSVPLKAGGSENPSKKAESLCREITLRSETLVEKYDQDLNSLSDYQILDISQNKSLVVEFYGILERVTSLASLVSDGADEKFALYCFYDPRRSGNKTEEFC